MKKFSISEVLILLVCILCIFLSEYIYIFHGNATKAIFLGLWSPTILGFLNYFNIKKR